MCKCKGKSNVSHTINIVLKIANMFRKKVPGKNVKILLYFFSFVSVQTSETD